MAPKDSFFTLSGHFKQLDETKFLEHLEHSTDLRNALYFPDELQHKLKGLFRIEGMVFENVSFSKTKITRFDFRDCRFVNCLLINTHFDSCEFHNCEFIKTNTHKILFRNCYINPKSFSRCLNKNKHQNIGVHLYQMLMRNSEETDQPEFEADAHFNFLKWKKYQDIYNLRQKRKNNEKFIKLLPLTWKIAKRYFWEIFFGTGIRFRHFFCTSVGWILIWVALNYLFSEDFGLSKSGFTITDSLYFTVVSLTTLGYGDITPVNQIGRLAATLQSVSGFLLFGLLTSMLFRKLVK